MLARHVRKASGVYAARHAAVLAALASAEGLEVVPSSAGLHVCARLPEAAVGTGRRVVVAARRDGVAIEALGAYYLTEQASASAVEGLVVGYGAVAVGRLDEGLGRLLRVLRRETTVS
jgi:GntR family transcriptional regulator / MocR family aminotransferase